MKIKQAIMSTFLVDSYSLGSHWIYDETQLKNLTLNWETLNNPEAMWHEGKKKGDFTHYGDHTLWLLEFLSQSKVFDVAAYATFWQEKMKDYTGYIDGSSRETLEHLQSGKSPLSGVVSHDLSICGRIAPLLLVSKNKEQFLSNALSFSKLTHNDDTVAEAIDFFASLIYALIEGESLNKIIENLLPNYSPTLAGWIRDGLASHNDDTFSTIRTFGPACGVEGGFAGVIHLITKYDTVKDMMKANAQAGGDSSARGMIAGLILAINSNEDISLAKDINAYQNIQDLLDTF